MIQMHRLEGFYWVATAKGYTAAARAFPYPITQPAVYQQVRKLEQDLDTTLFERVSRDRVELTAAGRRLLEFCAPFFEALPSGVREIEGKSFGGVLRIEAAPLEIRHVLPPFIQRLRAQRPDIELQLVEVQTPDPLRVLVSQTDFVIDYMPRIPHGVTALEIARHHAFLITPSAWGKPSERRPGALQTRSPHRPGPWGTDGLHLPALRWGLLADRSALPRWNGSGAKHGGHRRSTCR